MDPMGYLDGTEMQESKNLDDSQQLEAIEEDRQSLRSLRWTWVSWRRHDHDDGGYPGYPDYMSHNVLVVLHGTYHTLWAQQGLVVLVGNTVSTKRRYIYPEKRLRFGKMITTSSLIQDTSWIFSIET